MPKTQEKCNQSMETDPEMTQMLELADNDLKIPVITMLM